MKFQLPRMSTWLIVALVLAPLIWFFGPEGSGPRNLVVGAYKLWLVTTAAWLGYWIDRTMYPYARPGDCVGQLMREAQYTAAQIRRAIIVAASMLAVGLAL